REATRIEPALDEEALHRERHLLARERVHAPRRRVGVEAERAADLAERRDGALVVEHHAAAEEVARIDEAERDERVGDRRLAPAAAIAGGARIGAGAPRADAEAAARVDPRDAPAARADRVDGDHREPGPEAEQLGPDAPRRRAVRDDRDVEARAAHVARDDVG